MHFKLDASNLTFHAYEGERLIDYIFAIIQLERQGDQLLVHMQYREWGLHCMRIYYRLKNICRVVGHPGMRNGLLVKTFVMPYSEKNEEYVINEILAIEI